MTAMVPPKLGSLFDVIREEPNGTNTQKSNSIEHLRSLEMIHCDVKSLNFLLHEERGSATITNDDMSSGGKENEIIKLCDFVMSVRNTERTIVGGSPVYTSPEHCYGILHHHQQHHLVS